MDFGRKVPPKRISRVPILKQRLQESSLQNSLRFVCFFVYMQLFSAVILSPYIGCVGGIHASPQCAPTAAM